MYQANLTSVITGIKQLQSRYWLIWLTAIVALVAVFVTGYLVRRWQDNRRESNLGFNTANIKRLRSRSASMKIDHEEENIF